MNFYKPSKLKNLIKSHSVQNLTKFHIRMVIHELFGKILSKLMEFYYLLHSIQHHCLDKARKSLFRLYTSNIREFGMTFFSRFKNQYRYLLVYAMAPQALLLTLADDILTLWSFVLLLHRPTAHT